MMQRKEIKVFLKGSAKDSYFKLSKLNNKENKSIFNSINKVINNLRLNPQLGQPISKKLFPKVIINQYDINNLYRVELSNFWRLLYTIKNNEIYILIFIIEIVNHKKYNKIFNYKKK